MTETSKANKVLVLGATGMLGNAVLRFLAVSLGYAVAGAGYSAAAGVRLLRQDLHAKMQERAIDVENPDALARLCALAGARLAHMSTDCVFSGAKGMYTEADMSDPKDLYSPSKYLSEVDYPHAITLRTSIIGHELEGAHNLLGWFLAQEGSVKRFRRAIFSGLPPVEVARVIRDHVVLHPELHGLYHVSADPIHKFDLLALVAQIYGKAIEIEPDEQLVIDRSLDSTRFRLATGFQAGSWPELVRAMHEFG